MFYLCPLILDISDQVKSDDSDSKDLGRRGEDESQSIDSHPAWQYLLHDEVLCGESFADRIIGGEDAPLGQYPWIARLGYECKFIINYVLFETYLL